MLLTANAQTQHHKLNHENPKENRKQKIQTMRTQKKTEANRNL